jgi:two-component system, OmpR family, response regulator
MRILIAEDDAILANGLIRTFNQSNYAVDHVNNGAQADLMLQESVYDLVILDLGLPKMDGLEVLKKLRQRHNKVAVLILTARDAIESRVKGLDLGADDYLIKPFNLDELEARVRALIRRGQLGSNLPLKCANLSLNVADKIALNGDKPLTLAAREFSLLEVLMSRMNKVVNKEQLLEALCNWDTEIGDNAIEVYIHRLRKKIEPSGAIIRTIRGLGYLLEAEKSNG